MTELNDDTVVGQITRETAEENDCGRVTFYGRDLTPEFQALIRAGQLAKEMAVLIEMSQTVAVGSARYAKVSNAILAKYAAIGGTE